MKKIKKSVAVVAALLLMSNVLNASVFLNSNNSTLNYLNYDAYRSCTLYGHAATYLENQYYGGVSVAESYKTFLYYVGLCQEAGGYDNINMPIFL